MSLGSHVTYGVGTFLVLSGIVVGFCWPLIFGYVSKERLELNPSSETYKLWIKTPLPMYLEIYLFNWTNSVEFLKDRRTKPEFEEIGPFVFKEVHQRVNITWNENNTVSYNQIRTWSFVPEESLDLATPITNLNVIATTIAKMGSKNPTIIKLVLDFLYFYYKEKLLITKPAEEWLFKGMNDKLLDFVKTIVDVPFDKFGWFYGRNLSWAFDGRFNVNTGKDNIYDLGAMQQWNYVNKTNFYEGECGVVKGSSGELFSPIKDSKNDLSIFVTDLCGPLSLEFTGPRTVEGLEGYRYAGNESVFDNGTRSPSGKCFCTGKCSPSGVRNLTLCRQAPLFVSFPHFYLGDPALVEGVVGMRPNKSEHEFYLSIDPVTGIPLEVRAQLQINVLLEPVKWYPMFMDVPKVYVPMMWFRQRVRVTPELASRGKELRIFEKVGLGLGCGLALVGLLVIVIHVCFVSFHSRNKESEALVTPEAKEESDGDR